MRCLSANGVADQPALALLNSLLCSAVPRRDGRSKRVWIPPPSHLALLNTLVIHPAYTSRANSPERLEVSAQALAYLRNVLSVVGPINANLRTAFQFVDKTWSRRYADDDHSSDEEDYHEDKLGRTMANESSLWQRGSDFWSVVGWAFKCSVAHPHRWQYWKVWLDYMLDVLEADWKERRRMDRSEGSSQDGLVCPNVQDSMLIGYMKGPDGRCRSLRELLKALFADGSKPSMLTFKEIFNKELKSAADQSKKRKREKDLDLEHDKFGDYYDEDDGISSGGSQPPTPEKRRRGGLKAEAEKPLTDSMTESIHLRLRLFGLLSKASVYCGKFFTPPYELYPSFAVALYDLPLEAFALFISRQACPLVKEAQCQMAKDLMPLLLPSSAKAPEKVDPDMDESGGLSQLVLEQCYLPYAATTVSTVDNAKISLLLENITQLLLKSNALAYTTSLRKALDRGIEARESKVGRRRGGRVKGDSGHASAIGVLESSGKRLRLLVDLAESLAEEPELIEVDEMPD
jgi:hypothetical protein